MPLPLIPLAAGLPAAGAASGGFMASAGGAATIDLIAGLLSGIFGGMEQKSQEKRYLRLWEKMAGKKQAGLDKYLKPKTPYSEWYKGKAAPMADYLQNILTQTMQQRGIG